MMAATRDQINEAVRLFLETATGKPVGLGKIPTNPGTQYAIMYPMASPRGTGSQQNPEEDRDHMFQVSSFGRDYRECGRMSDRVLQAMIGRDGNGGWLHQLGPISGSNVQHRQSDVIGAILPSGPDLFVSQDMYRITIGV